MVVVDYNAQTLSRHMASTLLLGKVTGQEARARKMADEYKAKIETIRSRIAQTKRQPPRVYIELGDKGPLGTLRVYLPDGEIDFIEVAPANGKVQRWDF